MFDLLQNLFLLLHLILLFVLYVLFQKFFPGAVDVPGADGQNQIPRQGQAAQGLRSLIQGGAVDGAGDLPAEVR